MRFWSLLIPERTVIDETLKLHHLKTFSPFFRLSIAYLPPPYLSPYLFSSTVPHAGQKKRTRQRVSLCRVDDGLVGIHRMVRADRAGDAENSLFSWSPLHQNGEIHLHHFGTSALSIGNHSINTKKLT